MTMRPLQNQVTDIAVFGLSIVLLGFITKAMRDMTADALGGDKSPALLPATAKEPWQMTREEWLVAVGYKKSQGSRVRENWLGTHEGEVRVAVQNRKPVPPEVLKDYPDIKPPSLLPATTRRTYTADQIFARAKEYFGTTTNPDEAGYILPDGTMLDFSGRIHCRFDHWEIVLAWPKDALPLDFSALKRMMEWGAIRFAIFRETTVVNLSKPPTAAQVRQIELALRRHPDSVLAVEVDDQELLQMGFRDFTHPFTNWKAFIEHTLVVKRMSHLLPQTQSKKTPREQAHQVLDDVLKAIDETRKADSIRRIERIIERIDTEILDRELITGLDDLEAAIEDYRGIERAGLTPEEYIEEKESAFEAVVEAAEGLDIDEDALEGLEDEEIEKPPPVKSPVPNELRRKSIDILDRLIKDKVRQMLPAPSLSDARKAVYKDILNGFSTVAEAREYVEGMPEDNVIFTARGDEIPFFLIKLIITDIERNPWLSPFRAERRPDTSWQPPLMPETAVPGVSLPSEEYANPQWPELAAKRYAYSLGFTEKIVGDYAYRNPRDRKQLVKLVSSTREPKTITVYNSKTGARKTLTVRLATSLPQTSTYYTVSFKGDTTFKAGEIVSEQAFKAENERVMKLGLRPARGWVSSKGKLLSWGNGWRPVKELEEYLPASIPRDDLMRIADKYGWWAAKLAQSVCPHNDVACVEREARRLVEARRARLE